MDSKKIPEWVENPPDWMKVVFPTFYYSMKAGDKLLKYMNDVGQIKDVDAKFFVEIIKACKETGVSEIDIEFTKEQMTGLDVSLAKVAGKKVGVDVDLGIKGATTVCLKMKFKESLT